MIIDFAKVTGDNNKIHLNEEYAKETVFKHRIAHGFLYGSFISMLLGTKYPGPGTVYLYQEMEFLHPVYVNDIVKVQIQVKEKLPKNKLIFSTNIYNQEDTLLLRGQAKVSIPK